MTPSTSIIAAGLVTQTITDDGGRRLMIRRLNALDRLRLFKAAGPLLSQNQPWLGMALIACSVTAIDDVPIPPPVNESQIEAMIGRLGDAGVAVIARALQQVPEPPAAELVANAGN
jgi:hypothetical protein